MNTKKIFSFLRDVAAHNDRTWFASHRDEYEEARRTFEEGVAEAIARISSFDPSVSHITVKDATYRFYRDTRFSPDKSPYKRHLGAYIAAHGKKSLHGGYYIHLEPHQSMLSVGNYYLPTPILTACRNEIMGNEEEWLRRVENKEFRHWFGADATATWGDPQGFGLERLKTCPSGFPKDYAHLDYLRQKDYCAWHRVSDDFFARPDWIDEMETIFRAGKPMMDFVNAVIDDYE